MKLNEHPNEKTICGIWSVSHDDFPNFQDLVLQRQPIVPESSELARTGLPSRWSYGQQFVFHENGEMVDFYGAPCRNDGQIHRWAGKWEWNVEESILFLQVENYPESGGFSTVKPSEAYKKGLEFQVTEMTEQVMKLKAKGPSETLWEYDTKTKKAKRSRKRSA